MRVAPPRVFPEVAGAPRPPAATAGAQDTHRQTSFVLAEEVDAVLALLEAEAAIAEASAGAKFRNQAVAATLAQWSRSWLARQSALHAVQWGNYVAAFPLVRAAAEYTAASMEMLATGATEWTQWLEEGGIALAPDVHATEYRLHAFRSGSVMAEHAVLGPLYRAVTDLAMPHFGATLLLAGNESSRERVAITFGDRDMHLGLAELALGWLLQLGCVQVEAALGPGKLGVPEGDAVAGAVSRAQRLAERADRCRMTAIEREGERRYLIEGWRRRQGDAARKVLL
jgi:hypothetical protein